MPKLRVIIKPPPEPQGEPEQQVEALRDYLLQMSEELAYVLTHLEADNINDSTFERIQSMIPRPYTGLPVMDGEASAGQSEQWARGDHRHGHDSTKADVTALEETADDLAAHIADTGNPHEVTKDQVGLGNVANERQYSAQYPPPIPTPVQVGAIPATEKGSPGGVAELDSNGMVPSAQLPSYVDDVLEYASLSAFPVTGESGKIYVALDTGRTYRWSGSAYTEISESLALGETSSTAYRGDRGKTAYDHSQVTSGNPHNVTAAEVGARPDTWTPSAADVGAQPSITANGILKGDGLGGVSAATAGTDYQAPLTAGTDYATPAMIPTVPDPSDAAPQDLGTADAGSSGDYSRADHVHNLPDADDIPYDNTGSGLLATDVQAAIDEVAQGGGGGGPSPATATPLMDGTGAVGSSLKYAREDHEHPADTNKQAKITASGILMGDGQGGVSAATAGTDYQIPLTAGTDYATPSQLADKVNTDEIGIIINGNTAALGASIGQYVILRNSTITGKSDGVYKASKAIPANTAIDGTYLTTSIIGGALNDATAIVDYPFVANTIYIGEDTIVARRSGNVLTITGYVWGASAYPGRNALLGTFTGLTLESDTNIACIGRYNNSMGPYTFKLKQNGQLMTATGSGNFTGALYVPNAAVLI